LSRLEPHPAASFKKGVLTVDLPKTEEAKKRAKRVEVKGA
jgi:HSP20 family molecular chaperone IbpA